MFKDKREELARLDAQLRLEEEQTSSCEDWTDGSNEEYEAEALEQFEEEVTQLYRNYSNRYGRTQRYSSNNSDPDPDEYNEDIRKPKSILGLCAVAMALLAGIFAVLAWWAVRLWG